MARRPRTTGPPVRLDGAPTSCRDRQDALDLGLLRGVRDLALDQVAPGPLAGDLEPVVGRQRSPGGRRTDAHVRPDPCTGSALSSASPTPHFPPPALPPAQ